MGISVSCFSNTDHSTSVLSQLLEKLSTKRCATFNTIFVPSGSIVLFSIRILERQTWSNIGSRKRRQYETSSRIKFNSVFVDCTLLWILKLQWIEYRNLYCILRRMFIECSPSIPITKLTKSQLSYLLRLCVLFAGKVILEWIPLSFVWFDFAERGRACHRRQWHVGGLKEECRKSAEHTGRYYSTSTVQYCSLGTVLSFLRFHFHCSSILSLDGHVM